MLHLLVSANLAKPKATLAKAKAVKSLPLADDYVTAKEFMKDKMLYKMNRADEALAAWKLKKDGTHDKSLKYHAENVPNSLTMQCPTNFQPCQGSHHNDHACCATETRNLFSECPTLSDYYDQKCWVPTKYQERCPENYELRNGKCYRHEISKPSVLCPEGFNKIGDTFICSKSEQIVEENCLPPAFRDGADCIREEFDPPTCPPGYALQADGLQCKREYSAPCDMKVPHTKEQLHAQSYGAYGQKGKRFLREVPNARDPTYARDFSSSYNKDKSYGHTFDKQVNPNWDNGGYQYGVSKHLSIDKSHSHSKDFSKDGHYHKSVPASFIEHGHYPNTFDPMERKEKVHSTAQKERTEYKLAEQADADLRYFQRMNLKHISMAADLEADKQASIRATIQAEHDKDMRIAQEAYDRTGGKATDNKVYKKVVKATCLYEDYTAAMINTRRVVDQERSISTTNEILKADASIVCPAGFIFNDKKSECLLFNEKPLTRICDGVVVMTKCMKEVPAITFCERPWIQDGDQCHRPIYAPGLYTWMRDHQCFGDEKYCKALYQYIKH